MTKGGVGERGKVHWLRFFTQKKKKTFVSAWDQLLKLVTELGWKPSDSRHRHQRQEHACGDARGSARYVLPSAMKSRNM